MIDQATTTNNAEEHGPLRVCTDGESTYTMVYAYEFMNECFILIEMLLPALELEEVVSWSGPLQVASPHQGPHHQQQSDGNRRQCPLPGCGKYFTTLEPRVPVAQELWRFYR